MSFITSAQTGPQIQLIGFDNLSGGYTYTDYVTLDSITPIIIPFKNVGDSDLIISAVKGSDPCFARLPEINPIKAGNYGKITIVCPTRPEGNRVSTNFNIESNSQRTNRIQLKVIRYFVNDSVLASNHKSDIDTIHIINGKSKLLYGKPGHISGLLYPQSDTMYKVIDSLPFAGVIVSTTDHFGLNQEVLTKEIQVFEMQNGLAKSWVYKEFMNLYTVSGDDSLSWMRKYAIRNNFYSGYSCEYYQNGNKSYERIGSQSKSGKSLLEELHWDLDGKLVRSSKDTIINQEKGEIIYEYFIDSLELYLVYDFYSLIDVINDDNIIFLDCKGRIIPENEFMAALESGTYSNVAEYIILYDSEFICDKKFRIVFYQSRCKFDLYDYKTRTKVFKKLNRNCNCLEN